MQLTILGSGTSHGIPVIGCSCEVCKSNDNNDKRMRCSALITTKDGFNILIDTSPEFRLQCIKFNITKIDAVLYTHSHADHLHGLDDLRVFSCSKHCENKEPLHLYMNHDTKKDIKNRFSYIFHRTQVGGGKPRIKLINNGSYSIKNPLQIGLLQIIPIPIMHGKIKCSGYLLKEDDYSIAYLTDCNYISDSSIQLVKNCDVLVIDGLRKKEHSTHFNFQQAYEQSKRINAKKTYFTHINHDSFHTEILEFLNDLSHGTIDIQPAYDGLIISK